MCGHRRSCRQSCWLVSLLRVKPFKNRRTFTETISESAMRTPKALLYIAPILHVLIVASFAPSLFGQAPVEGQWKTQSYLLPINPIHVALLHNGKLLLVAGSGKSTDYFTAGNFTAGVLDPVTGDINVQKLTWDMFCNGMTVLPDGRVFLAGGTIGYAPFWGSNRSAVFDPATEQFADLQPMPHGRWYPTVLTLNDGRVFVISGTDENGGSNSNYAFYTVGSGWSPDVLPPFMTPLYPRMHELPNGKLFMSASLPNSHMLDPTTQTWTLNVAQTNYYDNRTYGSS